MSPDNILNYRINISEEKGHAGYYEAKVQEAFSRLSKGKTVIMIAHRLSSIVDADRICVLKDGSIAEEGTHETLLQKNGVYAHMWEEYNKSVQWKVGA